MPRHRFLGSYLHNKTTSRSAGAMVVLSTDTDFAARTPFAREVADQLAQLACGFECATVEALLAIGPEHGCATPEDVLHEATTRLGEKITLEQVVLVRADAPEGEVQS